MATDVAGILHDWNYRLHNVQDSSYAYLSEGRVGQSVRVVQVPMHPEELEWMQVSAIACTTGVPIGQWVERLTERREAREADQASTCE